MNGQNVFYCFHFKLYLSIKVGKQQKSEQIQFPLDSWIFEILMTIDEIVRSFIAKVSVIVCNYH